MNKSRVTPEDIRSLQPNEVFTFGSNEGGRHGKGAAKMAVKFGAVYGQGEGLMGRSYGIATKDRNLKVLPLGKIEIKVARFIRFAESHPELTFLVTPIGCGLAGYNPKDIAPMFKNSPDNVVLPQSFISHYEKSN
jgi:hypothetical protein